MPAPRRTRLARMTTSALVATSALGLAAASISTATAAPEKPAKTSAASTTATSGAKTRAQVPWKSVGTGWVAADVKRGGTTRLVLASPAGVVYEIATLGTNEHVVAISGDGTHVVTTHWMTDETRPRVWDMRTGKATSIPMNMFSPVFTRPTGNAVMGFDVSGTYGRYGSSTRVVPASKNGVTMGDSITPRPDGLVDAVTSFGGSVTLHEHATFKRLRTLSKPAGATQCDVRGWANTSTLVEACTFDVADAASRMEVFTQNANGGAPKAMTTGGAPGSTQYNGFIDAATTSIGNVAISFDPSGGGPGAVYRLSGTRATTKVSPSSINPNGGEFAGGYAIRIVGDAIVYANSPAGPDSTKRMVAEYDVKTTKLTYLVGNNSAYTGEVLGFAMIDPRS